MERHAKTTLMEESESSPFLQEYVFNGKRSQKDDLSQPIKGFYEESYQMKDKFNPVVDHKLNQCK